VPHFVYVLQSSSDRSNYVGCTNSLKRRLLEHRSGKNFSTRNKGSLKLIYVEAYINQKDAYDREKFLKTGWGKNYLKKVLSNYLESQKLGG